MLGAFGVERGSRGFFFRTHFGATFYEYTSIRSLSFVIFHFWNLVAHLRVCQEVLEAG